MLPWRLQLLNNDQLFLAIRGSIYPFTIIIVFSLIMVNIVIFLHASEIIELLVKPFQILSFHGFHVCSMDDFTLRNRHIYHFILRILCSIIFDSDILLDFDIRCDFAFG